MDNYKWIVILFLLLVMLTFIVAILSFRSQKDIETIKYVEHAVDSVVGDMKYSTRTSDFHGWLICDGRSLSRKKYHHLYKVLGTAYGSITEESFNLPDARGRVIGLSGQGTGLTSRNSGDKVGEEKHTMLVSELVTHRHTGTIAVNGEHAHTAVIATGGDHTHTGTVDTSGLHAHSVSDPGHAHTQTTINDDFNNSGGPGPSFAADSAGVRTWNNIASSTTGVTVNNAGSHTHTFTSDIDGSHNHSITINNAGNHSHSISISDTGSSIPFNVMQPTLFIGNLFIFAGVEFSEDEHRPTPVPTPTVLPIIPSTAKTVNESYGNDYSYVLAIPSKVVQEQ